MLTYFSKKELKKMYKNKFFEFLILSIMLPICHSAVFWKIQDLKPGEPAWCIDGDKALDLSMNIYSVGEVWYPEKSCLKKECKYGKFKDKVELITYSCGKIDGPEHCLVRDLTKPYPECCPKLLKCCI